MAVVRWDPFRDLNMLQDRMNRLFEDASRNWKSDEPASTTTWSDPDQDSFLAAVKAGPLLPVLSNVDPDR